MALENAGQSSYESPEPYAGLLDLIDFEVVPVVPSAETRQTIEPLL